MYNFRTDLADERNEIYKKANNISTNVDGIEVEEDEAENIKIGRVNIVNENGEQAIGKPQGTYVTLDIKNIKTIQHEEIEKVANVLANELRNLINKHITDVDDILVVGLGNIYVTPDALGPKVVPEIEVTRHILQYMPKAMPEDTRPVSAIAPGVLGITGIETMEILKGIVDNVKPKMLIVIDALASRNIERISSSIQLSDTGIVPGAGVENTRKEISEKTLGIPVVALGIPTVVDLASITNDCIRIFIEDLQQKAMSNDALNKLKDTDNYEQIKEALNVGKYNMIVTPKEIDELIENMKEIVALGINQAL
ncbi:MAG: GPR endopeptidase [Clostridia bacterium]